MVQESVTSPPWSRFCRVMLTSVRVLILDIEPTPEGGCALLSVGLCDCVCARLLSPGTFQMKPRSVLFFFF